MVNNSVHKRCRKNLSFHRFFHHMHRPTARTIAIIPQSISQSHQILHQIHLKIMAILSFCFSAFPRLSLRKKKLQKQHIFRILQPLSIFIRHFPFQKPKEINYHKPPKYLSAPASYPSQMLDNFLAPFFPAYRFLALSVLPPPSIFSNCSTNLSMFATLATYIAFEYLSVSIITLLFLPIKVASLCE